MYERIFTLLKERGIQQKEIAEYLMISPSVLSDWKTGRVKPSAENISKIAELLNVSSDYLLGRTDDHMLTSAKSPVITDEALTYAIRFSQLSSANQSLASDFLALLENQEKEQI